MANLPISIKTLTLTLLVGLAAMQLGLWAFLGLPVAWLALALVGAGWGLYRADWGAMAIPRATLAGAFLFALIVLAIGGEGRFFYANTDWQVRNAVLRDLVINPWPFAYAGREPWLLRAPLGIYLVPALIGKLTTPYGAELALWVLDSALLALVLGLGAALFDTARARRIALVVVAGFSGMDVLGQLLAGKSLRLHMEQWAGLQYSSHITQAFWVPQHGLAGWIFAALYLLWRVERMPAVAVFAAMPLLALVSPLALMGCIPFAAHVFVASVMTGKLRWADVVLPAVVGLLCLPSLAYLVAGSAAVGAGASKANFNGYGLFLVLEVGGYALALWQVGKAGGFGGRFGPVSLGITLLFLIFAPFGQIGDAMDFMMRASIPALAVLSVMVADLLIGTNPAGRKLAMGVFLIGLATPAGEIARALIWPRAPEIACSYLGVVPGGATTYVAPLSKVAAFIRPQSPALVARHDPAACWAGEWRDATTGRAASNHPYVAPGNDLSAGVDDMREDSLVKGRGKGAANRSVLVPGNVG